MMHAQWNILEFGEREMHTRIQRERKEERKMRVSEVRMKGPARRNVTTILGRQTDQLPYSLSLSLSLSLSPPKGSKALPPDPSLKRIICTPFLLSLSLSQKDRKHSLQIPLSKGSFALHFSLSLSLCLSDQCTLEISVSLSLKMINCTPDLSLSVVSPSLLI